MSRWVIIHRLLRKCGKYVWEVLREIRCQCLQYLRERMIRPEQAIDAWLHLLVEVSGLSIIVGMQERIDQHSTYLESLKV